jgi:hypothetical protein
VYVRGEDSTLAFHALDAPSPDDVALVASRTHAQLLKILARHGRSLEGIDDVEDRLRARQPVLASCYSASAGDLQLFGDDAGQRTRKLVGPVGLVSAARDLRAVAEVFGVNVHAGVAVDGRDRARLERLCRYVARPMVCQERLTERPDGRLEYALKKAWKDGTRAVVLEPFDLLARVCALVPPPRFHLIRYHGVLAGHATGRAEVVRARALERASSSPTLPPSAPKQLDLFERDRASVRSSRHPWAWLLKRVFAVDVTACPRCGGKMRVLEIAKDERAAQRVLGELGLGPRAPPQLRPAPPGQLTLAFI